MPDSGMNPTLGQGLSLVDTPRFRMLVLAGVLAFLLALFYFAHRLALAAEEDALRRLARSHAELIVAFRNFYATTILPVVRQHSDLVVTHDYQLRDGALPIPATLTLDLIDYLNSNAEGVTLRLISAHPFPWRASRGLDGFERDALRQLDASQDQEYSRVEIGPDGPLLRYASPIRLEAACVDCHNSHPDSPKRDWRVGDVRGVQVISFPMHGLSLDRDPLYLAFAGFLLLAFGITAGALWWVHGRNVRAVRQAQEHAAARDRAMAELSDRQRALDAHAIVSIADAQGDIVYANDRFCRISGFNREELIGHNHRLVKSDLHPEGFYREMWDSIRAGRIWEGVICNQAKSGRLYWVQSTIVPVLGADGEPVQYIAVRTDITRLKQIELELQEQRAQAEAANQAKSEFLATMSHEIRTPMNGIIGMTGLLLETPLDPEQQRLARVVEQSAEALLSIINDILDLSKIDAGRLEIIHEPFILEDWLEGVLDMLRPRANQKGIELNARLDPEVRGQYLGDPLRLRQVLLNLAGNAVKFTQQGSVELIFQARGEGRLRISVRDTGIGIPADAQAGLFAAFNQVDSRITRRYGGTGLGLAISKRLVEMMDGEIGLDSREGEGSTFWFELPLPRLADSVTARAFESEQQAADLAAAGETRGTGPGGEARVLRVLVAEDNAVNQMLVRRLLEKEGHQPVLVDNGRQALERVAAEPFDLVLMDMQMPEMDGLEATSRIRALPGAAGRLPIIALTANAMARDRDACLAAGMDGFLGKPLQRAELARILAEYARRPGPDTSN